VVEGVSKQYQVGVLHHRLGEALTGWWRRRRTPSAGTGEGKFWALKDVSFRVARGETLGIIGRNGAGKSTMLKLLSGISRPTQGTVGIHGKLAALIEVGAGFHPDLTGRENVYLNGTILGLKRSEIRSVFDQIVDFAEIGPFIDTPVKRYSSGMYVRLGFAIAVHINPDVLLIDEVLSVGDMAFQQKCMQRIHELKQAGKTLIFISHNLSAVQRICDRALLLDQGRVVQTGEVEEVVRLYREQVVSRERERTAKQLAGHERSPKGARVAIESVRLLDRHGRPVERLAMSEPATVEVAYACRERVPAPSVRIGLERADGIVCHVAWSHRDGISVPPLEGRGTVRLRYDSLGLLPNAYRITVEIGEQGNPVPFDARKHAAFFTITSESREGGAVHLDYAWAWGPDGDGTRRSG
jgi:ABC-type polysaccharide/polyol phosphate transport system ATPase subunit